MARVVGREVHAKVARERERERNFIVVSGFLGFWRGVDGLDLVVYFEGPRAGV